MFNEFGRDGEQIPVFFTNGIAAMTVKISPYTGKLCQWVIYETQLFSRKVEAGSY